MISTTTVGYIDLINLSKDIAQLNLGYLGISVAILGVLGGVFVYFNIKPLKDDLNKQEEKINDLKKEATELLSRSEKQTRESLDGFKDDQSQILTEKLKLLRDNFELDVQNKMQLLKDSLLDEIRTVSDKNILTIKEILLSEMNNKILILDNSLSGSLEEYKRTNDESFKIFRDKVEIGLTKITSDVLELKAYKYDMEGKMGGIIFTIDALEKCLRDEPYKIRFKLVDLNERIDKYTLSPEQFIRLKNVLLKVRGLKDGEDHGVLISEIESKIEVESKPKIEN